MYTMYLYMYHIGTLLIKLYRCSDIIEVQSPTYTFFRRLKKQFLLRIYKNIFRNEHINYKKSHAH